MRNATWVVYTIPTRGTPAGVRAVCEQQEWVEMDAARPGYFTLVRDGITNEGEAERLARGNSGAVKPRNTRASVAAWADRAVMELNEPKVPAG